MASQLQEENELDGDWTDRFIQEIQNRPPIYNNRLPEHSDRQLVTLLWHEICAEMVPSWENLSDAEKYNAEKRIQGRWRNLRTCFRRELNKQKNGSSGRRRKYIFFDQLLFLLPILDDLPISKRSPSEADSEDENLQKPDINASHSFTRLQQPDKFRKILPKKKTETFEQSLLNISKDNHEVESFDEDKFFLLSLVPTFKKLNDSQKLDAKMEFLATLKRLTQPSQPPQFLCQMSVGYPTQQTQSGSSDRAGIEFCD